MQTATATAVWIDRDAEEAQLVRGAGSDPDAFASLYDRYVQKIYRYAYRRAGSHADAEDITAQVFRRALEGIAGYDERGLPFGAWLFRIARNLLIDRARAGPTALSLDGLAGAGFEPGADGDAPDEIVALGDEVERAWAAVALLPPLQRRAVALRFGRDLSHAEVGVLIGRSEAATKQLIYRAMLALRRRLAAEQEVE